MAQKPAGKGMALLVMSHGNLASELLDAAARILGVEETGAEALCIGWNLDSAAAKEQIRKALRKAREGKERVLILTDLFGGTPTNLSMTFYEPGEVEILTGANLPLVIKALMVQSSEMPLSDVVALLKEKGQSAIVSVSEVMSPGEEPER